MSALRFLLACCLVCPAALASDKVVPPGFNFESRPGAGPVVGVLNDGSLLLSTGVSNDELTRRHPDGSTQLFATGFGFLPTAAPSPTTDEVVVGDSTGTGILWLLEDLNLDGDALDAGEHVLHPVQVPRISAGDPPVPFNVIFKPGTDELYVSGSNFAGAGAVTRTAGGAANVFFEGMGFAADMAWAGDTLYVADLDSTTFVGRVFALTDLNGDDDAMDAGESLVYADGLTGAFGIAHGADGSVYVTTGFSGCVARLLPDDDGDDLPDGIEPCFASGFTNFPGSLTLFEGPGGFVPGVAGDGLLYVNEFGFIGNQTIRSAPLAQTQVVGEVANNKAFAVEVHGTPGAQAFFVLSLNPTLTTVAGIGDLCVGFGPTTFVSAPKTIPASGSISRTILIRSQLGLGGMPLAVQGIVKEAGDFGLGNALDFVIDP